MSAETAARLPVTVIIPAYNAAVSLPRAFASIVAQTRPPAEIIVVDDASTDATREVLAALCRDHPGFAIRTVHLEANSGAGSARNAGWRLATQDYIAFLDADDAWHPRKLEIQYGFLVDHPNVALCGHRCVVKSEATKNPDNPCGQLPVRMYGMMHFLVANRVSTPTVMLRRSVKNRFVEGKRYSEDYLLWMEIVSKNGPAAYIDLPLAVLFKARYGEGGLSSRLGRMRQGEIDTYVRLRQQNIIGPLAWPLVWTLSWLKFFKRVVARFAKRA